MGGGPVTVMTDVADAGTWGPGPQPSPCHVQLRGFNRVVVMCCGSPLPERPSPSRVLVFAAPTTGGHPAGGTGRTSAAGGPGRRLGGGQRWGCVRPGHPVCLETLRARLERWTSRLKTPGTRTFQYRYQPRPRTPPAGPPRNRMAVMGPRSLEPEEVRQPQQAEHLKARPRNPRDRPWRFDGLGGAHTTALTLVAPKITE